MSAKYFAILTNQGAAMLANATALGTQLNLTQLSVGDANGVLPTPDPEQTKLINQRRIKPLNQLSVDPANPGQIIAEQIIPENEGGFWIREIGLFDDSGVLIAVANCPETYKPLLQEGSGRTQTIRMVLIVSSTAAVTLKVDPSVVLATRKYADDKAIEVKAYADDMMTNHLAAADPHPKYAPIASPTFTGTPKAPTPPIVANDTRVATAAFVQAVIAALVSGDLEKKQPLDETLTDLSGKDVEGILEYLGIVEATTSQKGIVRLNGGVTNADNTLAATSGAVKIAYDLALSAYQAAAISLGKGQLLQNMASARALGATYTNNTGYPIAVYIRVTGGTSSNIYVFVNDTEFGGGGSTASNTSIATAFFIVPPGATYRTTAPGVSITVWSELR